MDRAPAAAAARPPLALGLVAAVAGAKLLVHLLLATRYGYFRDELYFLDCGRHLAWGYVDHAPLIGLVSRVALLLGGSLHAIRIFPALAGAAMVALTMVLAQRLGGGRFAQAVAGLAVLLAPVNLMIDSILSMNAFEPLVWLGCALVLVRIVETGDGRWWLAFGALAGIGLENKHSTLFFGAAVAAALLLTPLRRWLASRWLWLGGAVALLLFLPNLAWQVQHGFPTLEDLHNVRASGKNVVLGPVAFVVEQAFMMHPALLPLWLAGLWFFLLGRGRRFAVLGWTYLALLATFVVLAGKDYYLAPAYPMLFAGGAVALSGWLGRLRSPRTAAVLRAATVGWIVVCGLVTAPLALPLLSPSGYVAYQHRLGVSPHKTEVAHEGPLPQLWGDQFGWPELVAEVARIRDALPPQERDRVTVFAGNYGEAGAVNLFGPRYGLPRAISGHQTYFLWGPGDADGTVTIVLQADRDDLERVCTSVEQAGVHRHPWGMAEENRPIYICRGLTTPLAELWPNVKHWN